MDNLEILNPFYLFSKSNRTYYEDGLLFLYTSILFFILYRLILFTFDRFKPTHEAAELYNRRKIGRTFLFTIIVLSIIPAFLSRVEYLPTILGFTGVGIIITFREISMNLIGWILIHTANGFKVGDRIEVDNIRGDVINISAMRFTLMELSREMNIDQSTNRIVHFPNHVSVLQKIFVVSQAMDFVWDEIHLYLSPISDWEKAEKICSEILLNRNILDPMELNDKILELSKNYLVRLGKTTPIVYSTIENGKVMLSLRYMTPIREKRWHKSNISKAVLKSFKKQKIKIIS